VAVASAGPYASLHLAPEITTPAPHYSVFYRLDALPAAQLNSIKALNCRVKMLDFRCCGLLWICCTSLGRIPRVTVRAGFKCVEALGRIIIRVQTGGVLCVVVCLEQGADNSMICIYKLYDLHAIFYSRLPVSKSIFMFP